MWVTCQSFAVIGVSVADKTELLVFSLQLFQLFSNVCCSNCRFAISTQDFTKNFWDPHALWRMNLQQKMQADLKKKKQELNSIIPQSATSLLSPWVVHNHSKLTKGEALFNFGCDCNRLQADGKRIHESISGRQSRLCSVMDGQRDNKHVFECKEKPCLLCRTVHVCRLAWQIQRRVWPWAQIISQLSLLSVLPYLWQLVLPVPHNSHSYFLRKKSAAKEKPDLMIFKYFCHKLFATQLLLHLFVYQA